MLTTTDPLDRRISELDPTLCRGLELIALRALGSADEARDVVQETLARAVEAIRGGRIPPDVQLAAFVHGIARHVVADVLRRRAKPLTSIDSATIPLPSGHPSPLESLIQQEQREQLRWALTQLSAEERRLLSQCFLEGESIQHMADRTGQPPERLRKRKSRTLERLRSLLASRNSHTPRSSPTSVS